MSDCEQCPSKGTCKSNGNCNKFENHPLNRIAHTLAVMSGKGGVGKSTVTVLLARELKKRGLKVGILDADMTGPSIPRLTGTAGYRVEGGEQGMYPVQTVDELSVMSVNYFLESEDTPVIWRGPLLAGTLKQFWNEVVWGELDVLLIDMPPGTGDVAITVMQSLPLSASLMVTTPQDMVGMIVRKAVNMADQVGVPVLGAVENYSFMRCPCCGKETRLFHSEAKEPLHVLARLPLCEQLGDSSAYRRMSSAFSV